MVQIAITSRTSSKEVRFLFESTKQANTYIRKQAKRKGMKLHYGRAYNEKIEITPLF